MRDATILLLLWALPICAHGQTQPRYIASREVLLAFGGGEGVDGVEAWLTQDDGKSWSQADIQRMSVGSVRYTAERDGRYDFYLALVNDAGRSAAPPASGDKPHISVIVDTAPPTLQIRRAAASSSATTPTIDLRLTLLDENLGRGGLRLFYRGSHDEQWKDGGTLAVPPRANDAAGAVVSWPTPEEVAERIDLLLVCTDLAGNAVREEVIAVRTARKAPTDSKRIDEAALAAASRHSGEDVAATAAAKSRTAGSQTQSPGSLERAEKMRALAARFMSEGRMDLAAARFSDALVESPNDPQLLTEFGTALVRSNRLDDARQRFEAALEAAPKNTAALEGLALVALGQQRVTDARDTLKRLLEIDAGAGRVWLRYGDVEYRMGNKSAAFEAWKKAEAATTDAQLQGTVRDRLKSLHH